MWDYDVAVIGAGPSGMTAAREAAGLGARVLLLERNDRPGRKLAITGKGRCNLTNAGDVRGMEKQIVSNPRFVLSALHRFTNRDLMERIETLGVPLKVERGDRVFPVSDRAQDIVEALVRDLRSSGVHLHLKERVRSLLRQEDGWRLLTDGGAYTARRVIVATGGASYPATGSTGDGYRFARETAHAVVAARPALVPLVAKEPWVGQLMGLSLRNVGVRLCAGDEKIGEDFGEMLFTHFGVSGPVILSLSSLLQKYLRDAKPERISLTIDLKPALSLQTLDKRLLRDFEKYAKRLLPGAMEDLLPKRLIPVVLSEARLTEPLRAGQISREKRMELCGVLKGLSLTVQGFRSMAEAIITAGGVDVRQIDPRTMESKKVPGLYFAGEVLDVDALTGGYNLQIAFSTGVAAGQAAAKDLKN